MPDVMKSVIWTGVRAIEVGERPVPELQSNETLIKVESVGICGTDIAIWNGRHPRAQPPLIPGHEFGGVVADHRGPLPEGVQKGSRVLCYPMISCGHCYTCRSGFAYVCENLRFYGIDVDGGMAEYVKVASDTVIPVPESWDGRRAAMMEPLAVAVHALRKSAVKPGDRVLVLGAGIIGIFCALMAKIAGAVDVVIADFKPFRLEKAAELGLTPLNLEEEDLATRAKEITAGVGFDVTMECSGSGEAPINTTETTRVLGEILIVGVPKPPTPMDLRAVSFKELRLVGVRVYEKRDFLSAIRLTEEGRVEVNRLITHEFHVDKAPQAFDLMAQAQDSIKIQLHMER